MSEWQPVSGWPHYEVSRSGVIRERNTRRVLGIWLNQDGYALVRLSNPRAVERVHRIVAKAFVQNSADKPFVNHIDNNRSNNRAENLEWCTQQENLAHARKQKRIYSHPSGAPSPNRSLSTEQVKTARLLRLGGLSYASIAKHLGTSKRTVGRIINGESYVR